MVFEQLISEKCKFMKIKDGKLVYLIGLYVDDMLITFERTEINNAINIIKINFKMLRVKPINYIFGIKIEKEDNKYIVS